MARTRVGRLGFTLTEVMIAVLLVSFAGIAIANFDFFASGVIRRAERILWLDQEPRRLQDWMRQDMMRATSVKVFNHTCPSGEGDRWGVPPLGLGLGVAGNAIELTIDDNETPSDPNDDDIVRYSLTTCTPVIPTPNPGIVPDWNDSLSRLIRRNTRPVGLAPLYTLSDWNATDIVAGLTENQDADPEPEAVLIEVTQFEVTKTTDPARSQFPQEPGNVLRVTLTVSRTSESMTTTFTLQSRVLRARYDLPYHLFAFLRRGFP